MTSCVKEIENVVVEETSEEVIETTQKIVSTIKAHEETEDSKIRISNFDDFESLLSEAEVNKGTESEIVEETTEETKKTEEIEETKHRVVLDENYVKSDTYDNKSKYKYESTTAPVADYSIQLTDWNYGMTPIDWVFIEPDVQLISNNKPNSSSLFGYKMKASSGLKGCFVPIYSKCDSLGSDYDGRIYCIQDYTKSGPEDMLYGKGIASLTYEGHRVIDILGDKYNVVEISPNVARIGGTYINAIYVDELDEILGK